MAKSKQFVVIGLGRFGESVAKTLYGLGHDVLAIDMNEDMVLGFKNGVNLSDGECKSASLEITGKNTGIVILIEGRYHQIKRMFGCFGAKVVELERIKMGNFTLPSDLKQGDIREFTKEELESVRS